MNSRETLPPPDKKRRTETVDAQGGGDSLWDDDDCDNFTEDQWENIDVLVASSQQASSSTAPRPQQQQPRNLQPQPRPLQTRPNQAASPGILVGRGTAKSKSSSDAAPSQGARLLSGATGRHGLLSGPGQQGGVGRQSATGVPGGSDPQQEIQKLLKQVEELKKAQFSTSGRIKILQQNVASKDAELLRIRQEKAAVLDQKAKETSEKEKQLDREISKLQTQLQFKEREISELTQQCKSKETQLAKFSEVGSEGRRSGTSTKVHTPQASPKNKTAISPKLSSDFPTRQSFQEVSPASKQSLSKKFGSEKEAKCVPRDNDSEKFVNQCLNVKTPRGQVTGQQLVSKLTHAHSGTSDVVPTLLRPHMSNCSTLESSTGSTETQSSLSTSTLASYSESSQEELSADSVPLTSDDASSTSSILLRTVYAMRHSATVQPVRELLAAHDGDVGLLLPVISAGLAQCLEYWESEEEAQAGDLSSSPSAHGSSSDSWTQSEASPARRIPDCASATATESDVVPLLRLLLSLVENSQRACQLMLGDFNDGEDENHEMAAVAGCSKSCNTGDEQNCSNIPKMAFLHKLCSFFNPGSQILRHSSTQVRTLALDILSTVLESAKPTELLMNTQLLLDSLVGCLVSTDNITERVTLAVSMLKVVNSIVRSEHILNVLCSRSGMLQPQTQSYQCLLGRLYDLCGQSSQLPKSLTSVLHAKTLEVLSTAAACQGGAVNQLLNPERECQCGEVVQRLICMLHDSWQSAQGEPAELDLVRSGLSILQIMSHVEQDFPEHRDDMEHLYVDLVSNMDQVFSHELSSAHVVEKYAIHDLADFRHDLPMEDDDTEDSQEHANETSTPPAPTAGAREAAGVKPGTSRSSGSTRITQTETHAQSSATTSQDANKKMPAAREPGKLSRRKNSTSVQRQNSGKHAAMDVSH